MTDYLLDRWPHNNWVSTAASSAGRRWMWMDLNGTVVADTLPEQPVIASWVWGWSPGEWFRLRLDGSTVLGARLREAGPDGVPEGATAVTAQPIILPRRGRNPGDVIDGQVRVIEIDEPAIAFLQVLE